MLDLFRRRDTVVRYVLTFFLCLIALAMVVTLVPGWGSGGGGTNPDDEVLAEIGDEKIRVREVISNIQTVVRQRSVPAATLPALIDTMIDGMLSGRVMAWQARDMGLRVSEQDLAANIKSSFPQLFPNGQYVGDDIYRNFLASNNTTIPDFEENMRRDILRVRLKQMAGDGIVVSPKEVEDEFRLANEKLKIEYVALSEDSLKSAVTVSDAEVAAEFEKTKGSYMNPQRYSYSLLVLDPARTAALMPVKDEDILREYNRDKERFRTEERVKVRHILVKADPANAAAVAAAEAKAKGILKQIRGGADFATLAKQNSEDPGSKENGGELGFITRGQTVPEFEKASFTLKPNDISEPVKTSFGFHIIQPQVHEQAGIQPFESVKTQLAAEVNKDLIFSRMMANAEQLRNALLKNPNDIDGAAAKFNAFVAKMDAAEMTGIFPGIGQSPELQEALPAMKKLEVGKVMTTQMGAVFVPVMRDIVPPSQKSLAEAAAAVKQGLLTRKTTELLKSRSPELATKAKSGSDFAALAKQLGGEYKKPPVFGRTEFVEGLGAGRDLEQAFKAPVGTVIGPLTFVGREVAVRVLEKMDADMSKLPAEREGLLKRLKEKKAKDRTDVFEDALVDHLMQTGKVKIYEKARQRVNSFFRTTT